MRGRDTLTPAIAFAVLVLCSAVCAAGFVVTAIENYKATGNAFTYKHIPEVGHKLK